MNKIMTERPFCSEPMPVIQHELCSCYLDEGHDGQCVCGLCDEGTHEEIKLES